MGNSVGMTLIAFGLEEGKVEFCSGGVGAEEETRFSGEGDLCTEGYAGARGGARGGEASL